MSILKYFKAKCLATDDNAHSITNSMYVVLTLTELQQRNEERLAAVKEAMGTLYILHPAHSISRKENV